MKGKESAGSARENLTHKVHVSHHSFVTEQRTRQKIISMFKFDQYNTIRVGTNLKILTGFVTGLL